MLWKSNLDCFRFRWFNFNQLSPGSILIKYHLTNFNLCDRRQWRRPWRT